MLKDVRFMLPESSLSGKVEIAGILLDGCMLAPPSICCSKFELLAA